MIRTGGFSPHWTFRTKPSGSSRTAVASPDARAARASSRSMARTAQYRLTSAMPAMARSSKMDSRYMASSPY